MKYPLGTTFKIVLPESMNINDYLITRDVERVTIDDTWSMPYDEKDEFIYLGECTPPFGLLHDLNIDHTTLSVLKSKILHVSGMIEVPIKFLKETSRIIDIRQLPAKSKVRALMAIVDKEAGYLIYHKNKKHSVYCTAETFLYTMRKNVPALSLVEGVKGYIEGILRCTYKPEIRTANYNIKIVKTPYFACYDCLHTLSITEIAALVEQQTELELQPGQKPRFKFACPVCKQLYIIKNKKIVKSDNTDIAQVHTVTEEDMFDFEMGLFD